MAIRTMSIRSWNITKQLLSGSKEKMLLVPMKSYTLTSSVGQRSLGDYHYGTDIDGGYGANIYAPAAGIVYEVSNDCPPSDGYLGNSCPYSGGYIGGGNYVMLKVTNKKKIIMSSYAI
ncbi:MAG: hypothetical protein ACLRTA_06525 [Clostridia bacterium]